MSGAAPKRKRAGRACASFSPKRRKSAFFESTAATRASTGRIGSRPFASMPGSSMQAA